MMHNARFRVENAIPSLGRPMLFLLGETVAGEVRIGSVLTAGPPENRWFRGAVAAMEPADPGPNGGPRVALGFRLMDATELAGWHAIAWSRVTLASPAEALPRTCACCGFRTLPTAERGAHEVCPLCFWEDDPVQQEHPDYPGVANEMSLNEARAALAAAHPDLPPPHG